VIDKDGFRANVGIILANCDGDVFWGKRIGQSSWQFPQGGIDKGETPLEAMYRELHEETGLLNKHVEVIGYTQSWLHYRLPKHMIRHRSSPRCIGQKQRWFLLRLTCSDNSVNLKATDLPEFDNWRWVNYAHPAKEVVYFKRQVYERAMSELEPLLKNNILKNKSRIEQ
jgi:putative (di)nucleoside polyphosphate hydrolase